MSYVNIGKRESVNAARQQDSGGQRQRERRGRSLEFMMRLESRFKLSAETGLIREEERTAWRRGQGSEQSHMQNSRSSAYLSSSLTQTSLTPPAGGTGACARCRRDALTLIKVELLVGRAVPQTFDVHEVAVDIRVVQRTESHVCKRRGGEGGGESAWTNSSLLARSGFPPAVFCFLMGMDREGLPCMPVDAATWELATAIMAGAAEAGAGGVATAVFFTVFLGDSEEIGTLLSSYSFLLTVLLI